jgi:cytidine deaminase
LKELKYKDLNDTQKRLLDEAEKAMQTSYNPYSHFYVGAALLSDDGKIVTGSNIENAAYGSTVCAERAAISRANAIGIKAFDKLAVIGKGNDSDCKKVCGPCGGCRQMIYEFSQISGKDTEIIMSSTKKDKIIIATIKELLPLAFGPKDLGVDLKEFQ